MLDCASAGRAFDIALLAVDPCRERGEFYTFVSGGPIFRWNVPSMRGEIVRRESWCFCDILLGASEEEPG